MRPSGTVPFMNAKQTQNAISVTKDAERPWCHEKTHDLLWTPPTSALCRSVRCRQSAGLPYLLVEWARAVVCFLSG